MAAQLDDLVAANYRLGLRQVRDTTADAVSGAYGAVDENDIGDSFSGTFAPLAAVHLEAGQAAAETLTSAYAGALTGAEPPRTSLAGTTAGGIPIIASLPGILGMLLAAIRDGRPVAEALAMGRYLSLRFTDNELSRVIDTTLERQANGKPVGWRGITHGPQDACRSNDGVHPFSQPMVRHPGCRCERVLVRAAA